MTQNFRPMLTIGHRFEARCRNILGLDGYDSRPAPQLGWDFEFNGNGEWWRVECKADLAAQKTGNLFFETLYHGNPSGIEKTMAHYWLHGVGEDGPVFLFRTSSLRQYLQQAVMDGTARLVHNGGDEGASCGILLPVVAAKNIPGFKELF